MDRLCRRTCGRSTAWQACWSSKDSSVTSPRTPCAAASPSNSSTPSTARTSSRSRWPRELPVTAADHLVLTRIIVGQGGQAARNAGQPVSGAVRRQRRIRCPPTLFTAKRRRATVLRRRWRARHDRRGGVGPRRPARGPARRAGACCAVRSCRGCGSRRACGRARYVCWGTDNREAAVRFVPGGPSNPHGANVEVKIVDPSANPYFATAAILGLALDGIERQARARTGDDSSTPPR